MRGSRWVSGQKAIPSCALLAWAALALVGCGTSSGGGGGVGGLDAGSDVSLTFGKDGLGTKDTGAGKDAGGTTGDTVELDDATLEDSAPLEDSGFFDEDVAVDTGKDAGKDTGKDIGKDTGSKDTGATKDTGSTADVSGTCGNGTCDPSEACENCAVDCTCTPCNPLSLTDCKATEQCYVNAGALVCAGVGKVKLGEACKNLNDCVKGLLCVNDTCKNICQTTGTDAAPICPNGSTCEGLATSSGPIGYNLGACFAPDNCNLVTSSGCPSGQACLPGNNGNQCIPAGTGGLNSVCSNSADCAVAFLCLTNGATTGKCKKRCDTTAAGVCPVGEECGAIAFGSPPVPAGDNLGVCDVP